MKPIIGSKYKIIKPIDSCHYGEDCSNEVGDIIICDDFELLCDYVEFRSRDLHWDGTNGNDSCEPFGLVTKDTESWNDVLELVE